LGGEGAAAVAVDEWVPGTKISKLSTLLKSLYRISELLTLKKIFHSVTAVDE